MDLMNASRKSMSIVNVEVVCIDHRRHPILGTLCPHGLGQAGWVTRVDRLGR